MKIAKKNLLPLPFVTGFALQNYVEAEQGIIDAALGGYQYWYIDASLDSESPKNWNTFRIEAMLNKIEKYKVQPILHGNFKVPLCSDVNELRQAAIEYTKKEIELAQSLSAPLIIHGGVIVEPRLVNAAKKQALNNFLLSLDELYNYAINRNVTLFIENLSNYKNFRPFHYIFTNEEEFEFIFSSIDAKFFLDIGHANIGNESPKNIFEKYHKFIIGMSFSNNNGLYDQHFSLSKGSIDYCDLIASIHKAKWKGIVAFETRDVAVSSRISELANIYEKFTSGLAS